MATSQYRRRVAPPFSHAGAARLLLAAALLLPALPALAQRAQLTHAEQPAKLLRKTTVYDAPAGVSLQPGDIVESGALGVQIEWANGALMALGPASSVQLDSAGGAPALTLLRGWVKIAANRPAGPQVTAAAGPLDVRAGNGSAILHVASDQTELFVELGTMLVLEKDKAGAAAVPFNREQYVMRRATPGMQVAARPPRLFVAEMPRAFFDPLVAIAGRARPASPTPRREAGARDLADWRDVPASVNKRLVAQFSGRLADPVFARDADTLLAANPLWRLALRQNAVAKQRAKAVSNHLF